MGSEATSAGGGGGFRARFEHYLYSGEKKHVVAGIAIFAAIFGVPWYFMSRGLLFYCGQCSQNVMVAWSISFATFDSLAQKRHMHVHYVMRIKA
ncbi:hypothetical protein GUJ93_ZPchr0010g8010 [Zizania palustris]|uniref:Uncharacterized protein n=1 Tax=Zizania palustris TaxID=103762 RepID=A0A8J6BKQ6_ZIZPA|nr:hypothetical protein GUJ93_ZPchr0010g8010 [Zizania palustris]